MNQTIRCWIYGSSRKDEMYLYVSAEEDFSEVPDPLMEKFGSPRFVMELDLSPRGKLARTDPQQVILDLTTKGYHLQMPPELTPDLYHGNDL